MTVDTPAVISVAVTNYASGAEAVDCVVVVTLPASFTFISSSPASTQAGNVVTFDLGDIEPGHGASVSVAVLPTEGGTFVTEADFTSNNTITGTTHVELTSVTFDPALCAVSIPLGSNVLASGGDTFDCYAVGTVTDGFPLAGTGFPSGLYDGPAIPIVYAFDEDLESYTVGAFAEQAVVEGGWTGSWLIGENPFLQYFDDLESYAVGTFAEQDVAATGFTGNWFVGDGP